MKKILFVGDHPLAMSGNGNMMAAVLSQVDMAKYQVSCFAAGPSSVTVKSMRPWPFLLFDWTNRPEGDVVAKLLKILQTVEFDVLLMVGIDLWQYASIFPQIDEIRRQRGFKWAAIFPYDLQQLRNDWIDLMRVLDFPLVYSKYGLKMLKDHVPGIRYFRPPLHNANLFCPSAEDDRAKDRRVLFPTIQDDALIFGFVGKNQFRKGIPRLLKAFMEAKKRVPGIILYLHTELNGKLNLKQMARDYGAGTGDLTAKEENKKCSASRMVKVYNSIDCLVNCTFQEGLSWTPLEAMLCGTPVIASDTTAQTELVEGVGRLVPVIEREYVPVLTQSGRSFVDAKACSVGGIREAIVTVAKDADLREKMRGDGIRRAKRWLAGVSDINPFLAEATKKETVTVQSKIKKILFIQHSAAGDVLMTTQCLKGIKERHKGLELCYMTQPQYADIVAGNPHVDEIVPWKPEEGPRYEVLYNPHGDHILRGGFNSLDVPLYSMYPHFCRVEPDEIFIEQVPLTGVELPEEYIVVHTTGGDPEYRVYPYMDIVLKGIGLPAVQLGSSLDVACHGAAMDFRNKLTFRESAWVVAHAKGAIVVDSFMSHLCGALGIPVVVLYGPAPARVVGPRIQNGGGYVAMEPNMLDVCKSMTRCWGSRNRMGVNKCASPCIKTLNPLSVKKAFLNLIEQQSERKGK